MLEEFQLKDLLGLEPCMTWIQVHHTTKLIQSLLGGLLPVTIIVLKEMDVMVFGTEQYHLTDKELR